MLVRNSELRMDGLSVGGWHDILDPQRLRMNMVEMFNACISDGAMGPVGSDELDGAMVRSKRRK